MKFNDMTLENLWRDLEDVSFDPVSECIEEPFLHFPAGTFKEDIWKWFDENHSKGVYYLLYEMER